MKLHVVLAPELRDHVAVGMAGHRDRQVIECETGLQRVDADETLGTAEVERAGESRTRSRAAAL